MHILVYHIVTWGLGFVCVSRSCFHVFYFGVIHGPCLCHASIALMYSCYWFSCSLCHVLIGSLSQGCHAPIFFEGAQCAQQTETCSQIQTLKAIFYIIIYTSNKLKLLSFPLI